MGPVLTDEDLAFEQLSAKDKEFIRKVDEVMQGSVGREPETGAVTPEMMDEVAKLTGDLCQDLQSMEGQVEAYEESLVVEGHHPVHKESIRGDAS